MNGVRINAVRLWISISALLVAAGWILSALNQLNRTGYGAVFGLAVACWLGWRRHDGQLKVWAGHWRRILRARLGRAVQRFRRPAPLLFLILALMALIGGALYVPTNGDSDTYRIPRVLHWLGAGHWHWIRTGDYRMNIAGCGWEWLSAPLILFTRSDRLFFLINWIPFLLLPGLVFSLFRRLHAPGRVAWWWAWLLSSGWCYVLQAGSICNDSFAVVYALASVDLALRARESHRFSDLALSAVAAALLTGAKQTNIPLALLWLVAASPAIFEWFGRRGLAITPEQTSEAPVAPTAPLNAPMQTAPGSLRYGPAMRLAGAGAAACLALLVSAAPIIYFNLRNEGRWTGVPTGVSYVNPDSPFWGVLGNAFCIPLQNLLPPIFPWTESWNALMENFVKTPFGSHFASFGHFGRLSYGAHGVAEGNAGIGLGIVTLTLVSLLARTRRRTVLRPGGGTSEAGSSPSPENPGTAALQSPTALRWESVHPELPAPSRAPGALNLPWVLRVLPWLLLLVFMAKIGGYENARYLAPYYPFLFPLLLARPRFAALARRDWWQRLALLVMLATVMLVAFSRGRPLFPARLALACLHKAFPHSKLVVRATQSFSIRSGLEQSLRAPFRNSIPADEHLIGYATVNGTAEPGLCRPFGSRRVERVLPDDTGPVLLQMGIHYVVADDAALEAEGLSLDQWATNHHATVVDQFAYTTRPNEPLTHLFLLRIGAQVK